MATNCEGRYCVVNKLEVLKDLSLVAYKFLQDFNSDDYPDGRYELSDRCYVNIESYSTQSREERRFEAHQKFIDVQYMISGQEIITVCPVTELEICEAYASDKDIVFYRNEPKGIDYILSENDFLIFRPGEGHMPCICINQKEIVRKAVIKIPVMEL